MNRLLFVGILLLIGACANRPKPDTSETNIDFKNASKELDGKPMQTIALQATESCAQQISPDLVVFDGSFSKKLAAWKSLSRKQKEDMAKSGALDATYGSLTLSLDGDEKINRLDQLSETSGMNMSQDESVHYFTSTISNNAKEMYLSCIGNTQPLAVWVDTLEKDGGSIGILWNPGGADPDPEALIVGATVGGRVNKSGMDRLPVGKHPNYVLFTRNEGKNFRSVFRAGLYQVVVSIPWVPEVEFEKELSTANPKIAQMKLSAGDKDGNQRSISGDVAATPGWLIDTESIAFDPVEITERSCAGTNKPTESGFVGTPKPKKFTWYATMTPSGGHCFIHSIWRVRYNEYRITMRLLN